MKSATLFVYGTLRSEIATGMFPVLNRHGKYVGKGFIQGRLFEVNGYPGVVESGNPDDKVYGEIYAIREQEKLLSRLDEYEGCSVRFANPHEYVRKKMSVTLDNDHKTISWVYLYNRDVSNLLYIPSGDYVKFMNE